MKRMILFAAALCLLTASCATVETVTETAAETVVETSTGMLMVQGACGMCKTRIEEAALNVNGVARAEWSLETKELALQFDPGKTSLDAISEVLAEVGHDTDMHKTDDMVYADLPECCKYRE